MKNIFDPAVTTEVIRRIDHLTPETQPAWGKMNVSQMLAHCNVAYEMVFDNIHPRPNPVMKLVLKLLVKNKVVGDVPYRRSERTAPQFIMTGPKDFEAEKARLIAYVQKAQQLGESHFEGLLSHSFGKLTATEWSNMFYKHLDHHLAQFRA